MSRDHRKLRVFREADALVIDVYRVTATLPADERFGLQSQLRRAAVSVAVNIVEGCARPHTREYVRFLEVAHGSARECAYLIDLAHRLRYLDGVTAADLVRRYQAVQAQLLGIVHALNPKP